MGVGKKAKNKAKAVKGKTKKDAGKVKHKGKSVGAYAVQWGCNGSADQAWY